MRFQQFPSLKPPWDCETSFGGFYNVCFHNAIAPHIELCGRTGSSQDLYYVRDNGVGFDMQHPDKLFRPVQRLHNRMNLRKRRSDWPLFNALSNAMVVGYGLKQKKVRSDI